MKKKILSVVFIFYMVFCLGGCQDDNEKETEISTFEIENTHVTDDDVLSIIKKFRWVTAGARTTKEMYFDDFIDGLSEISQDNAFA